MLNCMVDFWGAIAGASVTIGLGGVFMASAWRMIVASDASMARPPRWGLWWRRIWVVSVAMGFGISVWGASGAALLWALIQLTDPSADPFIDKVWALRLVMCAFGVLAIFAIAQIGIAVHTSLAQAAVAQGDGPDARDTESSGSTRADKGGDVVVERVEGYLRAPKLMQIAFVAGVIVAVGSAAKRRSDT